MEKPSMKINYIGAQAKLCLDLRRDLGNRHSWVFYIREIEGVSREELEQ
jgi:hypothetical protein